MSFEVEEQPLADQIVDKLLSRVTDSLSHKVNVYTIQEVSVILKCPERTVKTYLYENKTLRYLKIGREARIREEDLKEFVENQLVPCINDQEVLP